MKSNIEIRSLTSNLCVWYPIILSREKSFHHKKETKTVNTKETNKTVKESLALINKTTLPSKENKIIDTKTGQNED